MMKYRNEGRGQARNRMAKYEGRAGFMWALPRERRGDVRLFATRPIASLPPFPKAV